MKLSSSLFIRYPAFTLIELLIVMTISGVFLGVLFKTYTQMGYLSSRIQNTAQVNQEHFYVEHALDNVFETYSLDYRYYTGLSALDDQGFTNILYLRSDDSTLSLYTTGTNCWDFAGSGRYFSSLIKNENCRIEMSISGTKLPLTNPNKVYVSNLFFQLLPYQYYTGESIDYFTNIEDIQAQSIQIYGYIRTKNRREEWSSNAKQMLQLFYHLGK